MTDTTPADVGADTVETAKPLRAARVFFVVGFVTLVVLTFAFMAWIDVHVTVWSAGPGCDPFAAPDRVRGLTTAIGAAGLVGLAVSGLWLGVRPAHRIAQRIFWSAIVLAWVAVGGIFVLGLKVIIDCALVG